MKEIKNPKNEWYKCYSFNLRKFIETHGIYPVSSGINPTTDKIYYIYKIDPELSRILTNWTNNRPANKD